MLCGFRPDFRYVAQHIAKCRIGRIRRPQSYLIRESADHVRQGRILPPCDLSAENDVFRARITAQQTNESRQQSDKAARSLIADECIERVEICAGDEQPLLRT